VQFFVRSATRLRAWIVDVILLSQGQAISAGIGLFLGIIATEPGQVAGEPAPVYAASLRIAELTDKMEAAGSDGYARVRPS
jgi:xanthine/uracil/vitamin C permease (AzgA family)